MGKSNRRVSHEGTRRNTKKAWGVIRIVHGDLSLVANPSSHEVEREDEAMPGPWRWPWQGKSESWCSPRREKGPTRTAKWLTNDNFVLFIRGSPSDLTCSPPSTEDCNPFPDFFFVSVRVHSWLTIRIGRPPSRTGNRRTAETLLERRATVPTPESLWRLANTRHRRANASRGAVVSSRRGARRT